MSQTRLVSIVIAAFKSHETIAGTLEALARQAFSPLEVVVVDSSPDDETERIIRDRFPWVRYEHSSVRLLPHAARNRGIELAKSDVLILTDPDIYMPPDWVHRLVKAHEETGAMIVGAIVCQGRRWLDLGVHFSKYHRYLPAGSPRDIDHGMTAALLCTREQIGAIGGFAGGWMAGDTAFCREAGQRGIRVRFEPAAVAAHHHLTKWGGFLRERFSRGRDFAAYTVTCYAWSRARIVANLLLTITLLRLAHKSFYILGRARAAGMLSDCLWTAPLWLSGEASWYAGQAVSYFERLRRGSAAARERTARPEGNPSPTGTRGASLGGERLP